MLRYLAPAFAVLLSAAPLVAQEPAPTIADVNVTVDLENVDANALDHWPRIDGDLTDAILAAADPWLASEGLTISVVVTEISLAGAPGLPESGEFNRLGGWVYIREDPGQPPLKSEQITLGADTYTPGGTSEFHIIPGRPDFYTALLNVFAARTLEEVQELR